MTQQRRRLSPSLKKLAALTSLFVFWALGDLLVSYFNLAFPAAVAGLFLLFCTGLIIKKIPDSLTSISCNLIALLPLFLIPISVSITEYSHIIQQHLVLILLVILLTTPLGLACAALIVQKNRTNH